MALVGGEVFANYDDSMPSHFEYTFPFNTYYEVSRFEFIIPKEELNNIGIIGRSKIKSIGFNIAQASSTPINEIIVAFRHSKPSDFFYGGFPVSFFNFEKFIHEDWIVTNTGWHMFEDDGYFEWDGINNIHVLVMKHMESYGVGGLVATRIDNNYNSVGGFSALYHNPIYPYDNLEFEYIFSDVPETIIFAEIPDSIVPPNTPIELSPANNSTVGSIVNFSARLIDNDDVSIGDEIQLHVEYSTSQTFSTFNTIISKSVLSGEVASVSSPTLQDGVYYWRAKAVDSGGLESQYTNVYSFIVANNKPDKPTNLIPVDLYVFSSNNIVFNATVTDIDGGMLQLEVQYSTSKDFTNPTIIKSPYVESGKTASVLRNGVSTGTYYWKARTFDGSKYSDYTKTSIFKVFNEVPILTNILPNNNTVITSNSLNISAIPIDAEGSMCTVYLEVSKDKGFSSLAVYDSKIVNSGSVAQFTISNLSQGNYYWRMRVTDSVHYTGNYTSYRGLFVNIPTQDLGRLSPDSIIELTGLSGTVSSIQDDPDSPNASWLTSSSQSDSIVRVSFPRPQFNLTTGANLQNFRVQVRSTSPSGSGNGSVIIDLYENGISRATQTFSLPKATSSTVLQLSWNASLLSDITGDNVECRVRGIGVYSGNASNRWSVEVGAIEWNYQSGYTGQTQNNAPVDQNPLNPSNLNGTPTYNSISLSWNNPADADFSHIEIYRNGVLIEKGVSENMYDDFGLSPNTSYAYKVYAVDVAGNRSTETTRTIVTLLPPNQVPVPTIVSVSRDKISDEDGMNISIIKFYFDVNVLEWTVNVLGTSPTTGIIADSGGAVSAGIEISAEIDWTELYQEGENRINIYGRNESGWTMFEDENVTIG